MPFLILCIISSTSIFIIFRSIEKFKLPSFPIIIINYFFASILGFILNPVKFTLGNLAGFDWVPISIFIGIMFILMFFLIAKSSQAAGISVTTIASKMSVVFPIVVSLVISVGDRLTIIKFTGIFFALAGVILSILKPGDFSFRHKYVYLPVTLFIGMGLVDSVVKYAQHYYVRDENTALFSAVLFTNALITGLIFLIFRLDYLKWFRNFRIWGWGFSLGMVNFGSIYFLVRALNYINHQGNSLDSSIIFGINNMGIVSLSVLSGLILFKERLLPVNWIGVVISGLAIILFSIA